MPEQLELWDTPKPPSPVVQPVVSSSHQEFSGSSSDVPLLLHNSGNINKELAEPVINLLRNMSRLNNLKVVFTNNRHTLMRIHHDRTQTQTIVRLHWMFLEAPNDILNAVAHWIKHPRSKKDNHLFRAFFAAHHQKIAPKAVFSSSPVLKFATQGDIYDLQSLYDDLNRIEFGKSVTAGITWGRRGFPRKRMGGSIRFGSYCAAQHLIRIHPVLDNTAAPLFFVRYIVFHEMLHAYLGIEERENGRRGMHTPTFKKRERTYPDFAEADAWLKDPVHLKTLLRQRRAQPKNDNRGIPGT